MLIRDKNTLEENNNKNIQQISAAASLALSWILH